MRPSPDISRVWTRIDPANYYDLGEVAILRAYFGLRPRPGDPTLESLYEESGDGVFDQGEEQRAGPIRLRRVDPMIDAVNDLSHAVARICLSNAQDRLPQWATSRRTTRLCSRGVRSRRRTGHSRRSSRSVCSASTGRTPARDFPGRRTTS